MTGIISWIKPEAGQGWPLGTFSKCKHNEVKAALPEASFDCENSGFTLLLKVQIMVCGSLRGNAKKIDRR
jgi:hypothetical protein